jgi:hypothetical protein
VSGDRCQARQQSGRFRKDGRLLSCSSALLFCPTPDTRHLIPKSASIRRQFLDSRVDSSFSWRIDCRLPVFVRQLQNFSAHEHASDSRTVGLSLTERQREDFVGQAIAIEFAN